MIYQKANSILELRGLEEKKGIIVNKLRKTFTDLEIYSKHDPFRKALEDLFQIVDNKECKLKFDLREHVIEEMSRLDVDDYERYLRYRYSYEIYPFTHKVSKYPPVVQIEPTSVCNFRCVFCYQTDQRLSNKKNGHMGQMGIETFKEVVDELEGNVEGITLASRGEPTVNKDLPLMLAYLSGKFLATKINTNAFLLNEDLAHSILQTDLQTLVFSADAASEPLYSKMRVNGNLDKIVRNIEKFYEIKEKEYSSSKLITRVSGVRYSEDQNIEEMEKFWSRFVDQVAFVDYNPWENAYDSEKTLIETPCSDLWRRMFIWWDGKAAPCDVDYLTTLIKANINNSSITEIWNSDSYNTLRQQHLEGKRGVLEPCSRCAVV